MPELLGKQLKDLISKLVSMGIIDRFKMINIRLIPGTLYRNRNGFDFVVT